MGWYEEDPAEGKFNWQAEDSCMTASQKVRFRRQSKKLQMQGTRILRNEAYLQYVGMTKDEAQRRRWTFYEAVLFCTLQCGSSFGVFRSSPTRKSSSCQAGAISISLDSQFFHQVIQGGAADVQFYCCFADVSFVPGKRAFDEVSFE